MFIASLRVWFVEAAQRNVQRSLIREMVYEFKLGYNAAKATKNICRAKVRGAVDHSTVNISIETRGG